MAYLIELAHDSGESLYIEMAFLNKNTGGALATDGVDHQLFLYARGYDYQDCAIPAQSLIASNSNGLITDVDYGVIGINIPADTMLSLMNGYGYGYVWRRRRDRNILNFKLLAVPSLNPTTQTKTIANIAVSLDERMAGYPRVMDGFAPIYPNANN